MNCPAGFDIASFVLHSGNHHHWDKCTLLKGAVGGHDFGVPFFTATHLHLQDREVYTTHWTRSRKVSLSIFRKGALGSIFKRTDDMQHLP